MTLDNELENLDEIVLSQEEQPKYFINHLVSANKLKVYLRIELFDKQAEIDS
ncbi:MAG: hypothetical protein K0R07_817, partial [Sedimentibacter sp.]|nr:hypothetical protein [Sedimentibacter sp.]